MAEETTPAGASKGSEPVEKTPETFITEWPLYTPFEYEGFHPPARISLACDHEKCKKETTWARVTDVQRAGAGDPRFCWVRYVCGLCGECGLIVMYQEMDWKEKRIPEDKSMRGLVPPAPSMVVVSKVQKCGQIPALSISISKPLEKNLGSEAAGLYKKALANRNEGYGLGAVTYMRRVVEDKTDELIEVVAGLAEAHNVEAAVVETIRAAKNERTTYDNKLKIAATVLPDSLVIDGVNPLRELYGLVSVGVHDRSEQECIRIADETKSVFEFTFTRLRAETEARKDFVQKIKKWAGNKGAQTP